MKGKDKRKRGGSSENFNANYPLSEEMSRRYESMGWLWTLVEVKRDQEDFNEFEQ
jgi:hypothetical protein